MQSNPILMMVVMFAIFYFVLIRPQTKRQRERQTMLGKLGEDDLVITRGGVIGRVTGVLGDVLVLEIQDHVRVRVPRAYVDGKWTGTVRDDASRAAA
jgi:preprotein translocase subunit YajC